MNWFEEFWLGFTDTFDLLRDAQLWGSAVASGILGLFIIAVVFVIISLCQ